MALLPGLQNRERVLELMDDPALDPAEHRLALAGLARLNRFSRALQVLWPSIRTLSQRLKRPLRILDVATGCGDVPAGLLHRAARSGYTLEVVGCDRSDTAILSARANCPGGQFYLQDALHEPLPTGFDVVTCSLFLHHLSSEEAVTLLTRMKDATRHLVLVNDLARSRFNLLAVTVACHLLSRSRVVRFDGPASVRAAYNTREALELAQRAGMIGARVEKRFPCRFLLSWSR
jgi:SAM-dependent methyltransferase